MQVNSETRLWHEVTVVLEHKFMVTQIQKNCMCSNWAITPQKQVKNSLQKVKIQLITRQESDSFKNFVGVAKSWMIRQGQVSLKPLSNP